MASLETALGARSRKYVFLVFLLVNVSARTVMGINIIPNGNGVSAKPSPRRAAVPVLYTKGTHFDIGYDAGRTFRWIIQDFIKHYGNLQQFEQEYRTPTGQQAFQRTLDSMQRRFPYYVDEMRGIALGADVPFHLLFLLQMDDIIGTINDNQIPRNDTGGCSSIGINYPGNAILGHTEDAFTETLDHFYILSAHVVPSPEDRAKGAKEERFTSLCYAGHLPGYTMGFNENGLVFSINTLSPLLLKPGNTPRTFITRALLGAQNLADAERILQDEGLGIANGFSCNMLWTDKAGNHEMYNFEVAPNLNGNKSLVNKQKFEKEALVHCNLYQRLSVKEVIGPIIDSSVARLEIIDSHGPPRCRHDIENILSDTSGKSFQVFQKNNEAVISTIAAGIFDLASGTWSIYINEPNASEPIAVLPIKFNLK